MSASIISIASRTSASLDGKRQADEVVKPEDAVDGVKLSRLLTKLLAEAAAMRRRFAPQRTTFRDIVSTGSDVSPQRFTLIHKFGAPVEWWVVGVTALGAVTLPLVAEPDDESDADTLVIDVYFEGTLSVRVEESG